MTTKIFTFYGSLSAALARSDNSIRQIPFFNEKKTRADITSWIQADSAIHVTMQSQSEFRPSQNTVMIADYTQIDGCNYLSVQDGEEYYYYFIDDIEPLPVDDNAATPHPALVHITQDCMFTDFYRIGVDGKVKLPFIRGNVVQTTHNFGIGHISSLPITPQYRSLQGYDSEPLINPQYYVVAVYAGQATVGVLVLSQSYHFGTDVINGVIRASNIVAIEDSAYGDGRSQNVSIVRVYVLPREWLLPRTYNPSDTAGQFFRYTLADGFTPRTGAGLKFALADRLETVAWYPLARDNISYGTRVFLQTSMHLEEINYNNEPHDQITRVQVLMGAANYGSDTISILLFVNGDFIDVSADFEADITVNEARLKMSQNKVSTALNLMTNVIGAVGGAVGGFKSGDYFGGVSSIAAGVQGVTGQIDALRAPARMTTQGDIMTALYMYDCMRFLYIPASNADVIADVVNNYGLLYPDMPYISLDLRYLEPRTTAGSFLKLSNAKVNGYFDNGTGEQIAKQFENGVKFLFAP